MVDGLLDVVGMRAHGLGGHGPSGRRSLDSLVLARNASLPDDTVDLEVAVELVRAIEHLLDRHHKPLSLARLRVREDVSRHHWPPSAWGRWSI